MSLPPSHDIHQSIGREARHWPNASLNTTDSGLASPPMVPLSYRIHRMPLSTARFSFHRRHDRLCGASMGTNSPKSHRQTKFIAAHKAERASVEVEEA